MEKEGIKRKECGEGRDKVKRMQRRKKEREKNVKKKERKREECGEGRKPEKRM